MRLLFLTHRADAPSTRWRVTQFVPPLEALGAYVVAEPMSRGLLDRYRQLGRGTEFDVVILQKRLLGRASLSRLRKSSRRLVFEFDDAIPFDREGGRVAPSATRAKRFERTIRAADAVTTTNEYLAGMARAHSDGKPVGVFPNALDPSGWAPRDGPGKGVVIGWNGSGGNLAYLEEVLPALRALTAKRPGLRLRVVTDAPLAVAGVQLDLRPFDPAKEREEVRSFEIGIAPMPDDEWTRGKCPVKVLTYFAAGVPVAASDTPGHRVFVRDGENGLLVKPGGWEGALERLLGDAGLRARLGAAGRRSVETEFHLREQARRLLAFYRAVASSR